MIMAGKYVMSKHRSGLKGYRKLVPINSMTDVCVPEVLAGAGVPRAEVGGAVSTAVLGAN